MTKKNKLSAVTIVMGIAGLLILTSQGVSQAELIVSFGEALLIGAAVTGASVIIDYFV